MIRGVKFASFLAALALGAAVAWLGLSFAQAPASGCLAVTAIDDQDFARHAAELAHPSICISERRFEENAVQWLLFVVRNADRPGPLWVVPHDEEDAAFASAVYAVLLYGGVMVAVENAELRVNGGQDPNQIFAITPSAAETCPGASAPAPLYVAAYLDEWDRAFPVIGLHTNWDGYLGGGGLGTISIRRQDPKMIPFPSAVAEGRFADEDTIAMLPSLLPPAENPIGREAIDWLTSRGVHVIYRHVTAENNGCTLADYLTLNRLGFYANLEVEHGDVETQRALIDRMMAFIGSDAFRGLL